MIERFAQLPSALKSASRLVRLGPAEVPALLAHPDWSTPAPTVLWMHGRTVDKTLDPGRYLRWIRAGIAACAVDLPGHGERPGPRLHGPEHTLYVVERMIAEIDGVVDALAERRWGGAFDRERLGVGGMSAGGMAALRRCCDDHPFRAVAVESTVGDFSVMPYRERFTPDLIDRLDPIRHLDGWRCVPLLALHSERDQWAPAQGMRNFVDAVRERCAQTGPAPVPPSAQTGQTPASVEETVRLVTWPQTGAPNEHAGFGRFANDAKNLQVEFFRRWL
ncbi:MAG: alpha/beta fold hydrolase [Planctomycetota bacterium]|nr:MAG: alpha/beta fold hydrolase [Planctomycetota bacterium]